MMRRYSVVFFSFSVITIASSSSSCSSSAFGLSFFSNCHVNVGKNLAGVSAAPAMALRFPIWPVGPQSGEETWMVGRRWKRKLCGSRVNSFSIGPGLSSLFFLKEENGAMVMVLLMLPVDRCSTQVWV